MKKVAAVIVFDTEDVDAIRSVIGKMSLLNEEARVAEVDVRLFDDEFGTPVFYTP